MRSLSFLLSVLPIALGLTYQETAAFESSQNGFKGFSVRMPDEKDCSEADSIETRNQTGCYLNQFVQRVQPLVNVVAATSGPLGVAIVVDGSGSVFEHDRDCMDIVNAYPHSPLHCLDSLVSWATEAFRRQLSDGMNPSTEADNEEPPSTTPQEATDSERDQEATQDSSSNSEKKPKSPKNNKTGKDKKSKSDSPFPAQPIELTPSTWSTIQDSDPSIGWFVEFYAPWCGHCKALAPTWKQFGQTISGRRGGSGYPTLRVAAIDASEHQQIASEYGVKGYPTIKYIKNGKVTDYNGPRELDDFIAFAKKMGHKPQNPLKQLIDNDTFVKNCSNKGDNCLVAVMPNILDSSAAARKKMLKQFTEQIKLVNNELPEDAKFNAYWVEGAARGMKSIEVERALGMEFGYPAIAYFRNGRFAVHSGKMAEVPAMVRGVNTGRVRLNEIDFEAVVWPDMSKWDGKDAQSPEL